MAASEAGDSKVAALLLAAGADVNAKTTDHGATALLAASAFGYEDVVALLLEKGANGNARTSDDRATALIAAAQGGHRDVTALLLAAGADMNAKTTQGQTALLAAMRGGHTAVVRLLLAQGGMARVPAGTFCKCIQYDYGLGSRAPGFLAAVRAFEIDVTEVTVAQYRACVNAGHCRPPDTSREACNYGKADRENHPANCVNFQEAKAYCAWSGKRLPTEAEWEFAARGPGGRKSPPRSAAPKQHCVEREGTCEVGSYPDPDSPFGQQDMAGNVREWTASPLTDFYTYDTESRVTRGRSWQDPASNNATPRSFDQETTRWGGLGFRCAR